MTNQSTGAKKKKNTLHIFDIKRPNHEDSLNMNQKCTSSVNKTALRNIGENRRLDQ
jgi:hypothetical protein